MPSEESEYEEESENSFDETSSSESSMMEEIPEGDPDETDSSGESQRGERDPREEFQQRKTLSGLQVQRSQIYERNNSIFDDVKQNSDQPSLVLERHASVENAVNLKNESKVI